MSKEIKKLILPGAKQGERDVIEVHTKNIVRIGLFNAYNCEWFAGFDENDVVRTLINPDHVIYIDYF